MLVLFMIIIMSLLPLDLWIL